jgi:membrane protein required for colicin V production
MNYFDVILLIFLGISAIKGFSKGFIIGVASLAGLVLGIIFSLKYAGNLAINLQHMFGGHSTLLFIAAYAICFVIIVILVHLIGKSIEKVIEIAALGFVNRIAGAAFGILKTLFVFSAIVYLMKIADPQSRLIKTETKESSYFYQPLEWLLPSTLPFLKAQLERVNGNPHEEEDLIKGE